MASDGTRGEAGDASYVRLYRWVFGIGYERNVGGLERTVRYASGALFAVIGIVLLASPVFGDLLLNGVLALVLIVGGLYLIYEARVQYCPLNHTLERNTYSG